MIVIFGIPYIVWKIFIGIIFFTSYRYIKKERVDKNLHNPSRASISIFSYRLAMSLSIVLHYTSAEITLSASSYS